MDVMRKEYEEKIMNLEDERRELVMKLSAHASELRKSEVRNDRLQQEVQIGSERYTSLQLKLARIENDDGDASGDACDDVNFRRAALSDISASSNRVLGGRDEEDGTEQMQPPSQKKKGKPPNGQATSLLDAIGENMEGGGAKEGDCKQS